MDTLQVFSCVRVLDRGGVGGGVREFVCGGGGTCFRDFNAGRTGFTKVTAHLVVFVLPLTLDLYNELSTNILYPVKR